MAAASVLSYAGGQRRGATVQLLDNNESSRRPMLSTKRRRRAVWAAQNRPLFVAEAAYRGGRYLSRAKKAMLALYGCELLVLDVQAMEAEPADDVHALRIISYQDLLDVSMAGPTSLRLTFGSTSADKAKLRGLADPGAAAASTAVAAALGAGSSASSEVGDAPSSQPPPSPPAAASVGTPSIRLSSEAFTLTFADADAAQRAAAALLFQQAQYAAARQWLHQGLHVALKCDLVSVTALPLHYDDRGAGGRSGGDGGGSGALTRTHSLVPPHVVFSAGGGSACGTSAGAPAAACASSGSATAAAGAGSSGSAASAAQQPYPWAAGSAAEGWGCSVPLPASWAGLLDAAAAASLARRKGQDTDEDGDDDDDVGATLEELCCPVVLEHGPKALQVTFSTPLGAAVATITPQLARAALVRSGCCQDVLGLPLRPPSMDQPLGGRLLQPPAATSGPEVVFRWSVQSIVTAAATAGPATAAAADSSSSLGVFGSSNALSGTAAGEGADVLGTSAAAFCVDDAAGSSGTLVQHTQEAYAALTIEVVQQAPATDRARDAGGADVCAPTAAGQPAQQHSSSAGAGVRGAGAAAASSSSSSGVDGGGDGGGASALPLGLQSRQQLVQLQVAAYALLAGIICKQMSGQPVLLVLQLVLLAGLAALAVANSARRSSSSSSRVGSSESGSSVAAAAAATRSVAGKDQAASAPPGSSGSSEDASGCTRWSIRLVAGDVCSAPSRHLQMQVQMARQTRGMARLRLRMASMSTGGSALPQAAVQQLLGSGSRDEEEDEEQGGAEGLLPVLVSEPEPAWLSADIKQRFLQAKPSLQASQEQARRTDAWRHEMAVDAVLLRPCPKAELMRQLLPTYLLAEDSPEGHAVVLTKVSGVKDLCAAIDFAGGSGGSTDGPGSLTLHEAEDALALFNEYLVHVATGPKVVPAGFQIQIYDLDGFKLSHVGAEMVTLFKMLVRFGLYYPERLQQALVINAPAFFTYTYRALSALMDANTAAKVVVTGAPKHDKALLHTLAHHLGGLANVPAEWGGGCATPLGEYPAQRRLVEFAERLDAGQQPLVELVRAGRASEAAAALVAAAGLL